MPDGLSLIPVGAVIAYYPHLGGMSTEREVAQRLWASGFILCNGLTIRETLSSAGVDADAEFAKITDFTLQDFVLPNLNLNDAEPELGGSFIRGGRVQDVTGEVVADSIPNHSHQCGDANPNRISASGPHPHDISQPDNISSSAQWVKMCNFEDNVPAHGPPTLECRASNDNGLKQKEVKVESAVSIDHKHTITGGAHEHPMGHIHQIGDVEGFHVAKECRPKHVKLCWIMKVRNIICVTL